MQKSSDDSNLVDCQKSFPAQFIKSSENDCLKTHTNFDEAIAEAFSNIVVKTQSRNIEVLHKSKVVANKGWNENYEALICDSHFENLDTDNQIATQLFLVVFIKMRKDLLINLEAFNVLVMHCVC